MNEPVIKKPRTSTENQVELHNGGEEQTEMPRESLDSFLRSIIRNIVVEYNLFEYEREHYFDSKTLSEIDKKLLSYENLQVILSVMDDWKEEMFHLCVEWVDSDRRRLSKLPELLRLIPLSEISTEYLDEIVYKFFKDHPNPIIRNDIEYLHLFIEAKRLSEPKEKKRIYISLPPETNSPLTPSERLYVLGGQHKDVYTSVSKLKTLSSLSWKRTKIKLPLPRAAFGCAVIGQKIYICGGSKYKDLLNIVNYDIDDRENDDPFEDRRELPDLIVYDTISKKWETLKDMGNDPIREACSMAELNGFLYVAGGYCSVPEEDRLLTGISYLTRASTSSVRRYSVANNQWEAITPMSTHRRGLELVSLNGLLYAIGGHDGRKKMNSVESFNPNLAKESNGCFLFDECEWKAVANLNNSYAFFGSAVLNKRIYVAGGESCEVYDPEENEWKIMPAPTRCGEGVRLAVFEGKLLAIGGGFRESKEEVKDMIRVEWFNFEANEGKGQWIAMTEMNIARCHHGVAVVKTWDKLAVPGCHDIVAKSS